MNSSTDTRYWEVYVDQQNNDGFTELEYTDCRGQKQKEPISDLIKQVATIRHNNGRKTLVTLYK